MYVNNKNNFYHGIMFHHFHDDMVHKKSQGSINKDSLNKIIKFIGKKNILNAEDFLFRYKEKKLKSRDVCITFDDALKCQFDIALPVLEDLNIKGFFFIYSSILGTSPDLLEIYRFFRINFYRNLSEFYKSFFLHIDSDLNFFFKSKKQTIKDMKNKFPFYSLNDIKFRLVRDHLISNSNYKKIMKNLFLEKNFSPKDYHKLLFLNKNNIRELHKLGHIIGLHSHSHPTLMENLSFKNQLIEYKNNIEKLSKLLQINKKKINCMSHPNGSYNLHTLKILNQLNIKFGFKQNMFIEKERKMIKINNSHLEIAREDHSNILKRINV